jgi:S1-C subfamily serine protease
MAGAVEGSRDRVAPRAQGTPLLIAVVVATVGLAVTPAEAQVYRYRDEHGQWVFGDRPAPGTGAAASALAAEPRSASGDLRARLQERFPASKPLEAATLAVVAVTSPSVSGSGFFVSGDGHILTNRHVVRPTEATDWRESRAALEEADRELGRAERDVSEDRARLAKMEKELEEYRQAIDRTRAGGSKRVAEEEYRVLSERYRGMKRDNDEATAAVQRRKREVDKMRGDLRWKSSLAAVATSFTVVLKDGSRHTARLVGLGKDHDLALLRIDGVSTPEIRPADARGLAQGVAVYAIGSPLGMRDFMTSGIVTRVEEDAIYTDAKVLPGNSGGPLVTESGEAVGVNTLRLQATTGPQEGFGIAIPVQAAFEEFGQFLGRGR